MEAQEINEIKAEVYDLTREVKLLHEYLHTLAKDLGLQQPSLDNIREAIKILQKSSLDNKKPAE